MNTARFIKKLKEARANFNSALDTVMLTNNLDTTWNELYEIGVLVESLQLDFIQLEHTVFTVITDSKGTVIYEGPWDGVHYYPGSKKIRLTNGEGLYKVLSKKYLPSCGLNGGYYIKVE